MEAPSKEVHANRHWIGFLDSTGMEAGSKGVHTEGLHIAADFVEDPKTYAKRTVCGEEGEGKTVVADDADVYADLTKGAVENIDDLKKAGAGFDLCY